MHGPDGAVRAMEMLDRERIDNVHTRSAISAVLRFTNVMQTLDERQRANGSKQTHSFAMAPWQYSFVESDSLKIIVNHIGLSGIRPS